jgi:hypothetical protein
VTAYDFDPVPSDAQFQGDTLLEKISRAYEEAIDAAGDAENLYLAERSKAWAYAVEDKIAISGRAKHVDCQPEVTKALQEWNRAIAKRKRCADKAEELQHRQMACMSHQRFIREAT